MKLIFNTRLRFHLQSRKTLAFHVHAFMDTLPARLNLTNWYPFVVPYINGEWILHEPWYYGEHLVYDAADYEVNVKFATNGLHAHRCRKRSPRTAG